MRILHVSDLHAATSDSIDRGSVLASFLSSIEEDHSDQEVELVVFTGDLAFGGRPDEYVLASEVLLAPLMSALHLGPESLVLVPGNRDVDRDRIDSFTEAGLRSGLSDRAAVVDLLDEGNVGRYLDRLGGYKAFHAGFYRDGSSRAVDDLAHSHRI